MQLHNVEYSDSNLTDKGRKIGTQKVMNSPRSRNSTAFLFLVM